MNKIVMAFITLFLGDHKTVKDALFYWLEQCRPTDETEKLFYDAYITDIKNIFGELAHIYHPVEVLQENPERLIVLVRGLALLHEGLAKEAKYIQLMNMNLSITKQLEEQWESANNMFRHTGNVWGDSDEWVINWYRDSPEGELVKARDPNSELAVLIKRATYIVHDVLSDEFGYRMTYNRPKSTALAKALL